MADGCKELHERVDAIEEQVAALQRGRIRGIRKQAVRSLWGLPLYDIAIGPDPEKGEQRGHARGFLPSETLQRVFLPLAAWHGE